MITITRLETLIVDLPTIRPHKLAMHTMQNQTLVILRLHCSDGIEGIGEATTIGGLSYGNESPESIKTNIDSYFAPLLIGQDASNLNAAMLRVEKVVRGNTFAKSALETALLDALGKRLGLPVAELLGGRVRDGLEVAWTLASGNTEKDIEEAERMLDIRRHRVFKLKIGAGEPAKDIAHVAAIKRALGDRASVRVDLNQAWSEAVAIRGCQMLGDAGVDLIEQPIPRQDREAQARVSAVARCRSWPTKPLKVSKTALPWHVLGLRPCSHSRSPRTADRVPFCAPLPLPKQPALRCTAAQCSKAAWEPWPQPTPLPLWAKSNGTRSCSARCC